MKLNLLNLGMGAARRVLAHPPKSPSSRIACRTRLDVGDAAELWFYWQLRQESQATGLTSIVPDQVRVQSPEGPLPDVFAEHYRAAIAGLRVEFRLEPTGAQDIQAVHQGNSVDGRVVASLRNLIFWLHLPLPDRVLAPGAQWMVEQETEAEDGRSVRLRNHLCWKSTVGDSAVLELTRVALLESEPLPDSAASGVGSFHLHPSLGVQALRLDMKSAAPLPAERFGIRLGEFETQPA